MSFTIDSKLPHVGTTIFTVMTQRANETGAINLSQGFPNFDAPERLKDLVIEHVKAGRNQYAPMIGVDALREQIAGKFQRSYARCIDPHNEVTVTLGATEGLFSAILALVHAGDEVIVFDPSYDSYAPAIVLAGGKPVHIPLQPPSFAIDWQRVRESITPRTRLLIINSPHNPATSILSSDDLVQLAHLVRNTRTLLLADEVYEHMVFDGKGHHSICGHAELAERTVGVYSFGKSMHATGWRVGYTIASPDLTREIRRVHQFNTFTITTPLQYAIADFLREAPEHCAGLAAFYQRKRDYFLHRLKSSRFSFTPAAGTYFQLLDYREISKQSDTEFAETLIKEAGVAAIPLSPFYADAPRLPYLRFCFAKNDATLEQAAERLCKL
jgi:methionine aminotransferase